MKRNNSKETFCFVLKRVSSKSGVHFQLYPQKHVWSLIISVGMSQEIFSGPSMVFKNNYKNPKKLSKNQSYFGIMAGIIGISFDWIPTWNPLNDCLEQKNQLITDLESRWAWNIVLPDLNIILWRRVCHRWHAVNLRRSRLVRRHFLIVISHGLIHLIANRKGLHLRLDWN